MATSVVVMFNDVLVVLNIPHHAAVHATESAVALVPAWHGILSKITQTSFAT